MSIEEDGNVDIELGAEQSIRLDSRALFTPTIGARIWGRNSPIEHEKQ